MFLLIGLAITCISMAFFSLILGGYLPNLIDIPSFIVILCPILGLLTATRSFKVFYAGLRAAIFPKWEISEDTRGRAASLFRLCSKTAMLTAAVTSLICLINIFMRYPYRSAGGVATLGITTATILITLFYAMLFTVILFEPVVFVLKKRGAKQR